MLEVIKENKIKVGIIALFLLILIMVVSRVHSAGIYHNAKVETVKLLPTQPILKPIEKKKEIVPISTSCTENEVNLMITGRELFKNANLVVLNLDNFKLSKTKRIDNNRMGYYYVQHGRQDIFYTVFKNEPKNKSLIKLKKEVKK